jgi:hypothetical protein
VAQRLHRRLWGEGAWLEGGPARALKTALGHGGGGGRAADTPTTGCRADPDGMARRDPIRATPWQRPLGPGHLTLVTALTPTDGDTQASMIEMGDRQRGALLQAQTTGIDR